MRNNMIGNRRHRAARLAVHRRTRIAATTLTDVIRPNQAIHPPLTVSGIVATLSSSTQRLCCQLELLWSDGHNHILHKVKTDFK